MKAQHFLSALTLILILASLPKMGAEAAPVMIDGWSVGEIDLTALHWGEQSRQVSVTNFSDDYKFLVISSVTRSVGRESAKARKNQRNAIMFPGETRLFDLVIDVPENFTAVDIAVGVYEAVDTLDDPTWGTELFYVRQETPVIYPPKLEVYRESLPTPGGPLIQNKALQTDLRCIVVAMSTRGISLADTMDSTEISGKALSNLLREFRDNDIAKKVNGKIVSTLLVIDETPVQLDSSLRAFATTVARSLKSNFIRFKIKRREMIISGEVTGDSRQTMDGSVLLNLTYPLVGGIILWERLGARFLQTAPEIPHVLSLRSPCYNMAPGFGYILANSDIPDGKHFFYADTLRNRRLFAVNRGELRCSGRVATRRRPNYTFPPAAQTLNYKLSPSRIEPALAVLLKPLDGMAEKFSSEIEALFAEAGITLTPAHRFWIWNLVASEITDQLSGDSTLDNEEGKYFMWSTSK